MALPCTLMVVVFMAIASSVSAQTVCENFFGVWTGFSNIALNDRYYMQPHNGNNQIYDVRNRKL